MAAPALTAYTTPNVITPGVWQYVAAAVDRSSGSARLYVNGIDCTELAAIRNDFGNQAAVNLGRFGNSVFFFKGFIDEARIETTVRSSNWIWATFAAGNPWHPNCQLFLGHPGASSNLDCLRRLANPNLAG